MEQKIDHLTHQPGHLLNENSPCLVVIGIVASAMVAGILYSANAGDYGFDMPYPAHGYWHKHPADENPSADRVFLYDESSIVKGSGDISIKGSFHDYAMDSSGWMKGSGSINFQSLRKLDKIGQKVDFNQKADLVFAQGQLKNRKSLNLPLFESGIGATVNERFNLSHVDKSETDMIRSNNGFNNTLVYDTALAYEGLWNIQNKQGWSMILNGSDESYSGSFQTKKRIEYNDSGRA